MKKRFFAVRKSQLGFDETVSAICQAAEEQGWDVVNVYDLEKAHREAGHEDVTRTRIITLYDPHEGYTLLQDGENKLLSAVMPTSVSVYELENGQVHVAGMNLERISKMFRGTTRETLKTVAANRARTLETIVEETGADNRRLAVVLAAVIIGLGALAAGIWALIRKLGSDRAA
jgi:uncharacterized protein (DUF302 family)